MGVLQQSVEGGGMAGELDRGGYSSNRKEGRSIGRRSIGVDTNVQDLQNICNGFSRESKGGGKG